MLPKKMSQRMDPEDGKEDGHYNLPSVRRCPLRQQDTLPSCGIRCSITSLGIWCLSLTLFRWFPTAAGLLFSPRALPLICIMCAFGSHSQLRFPSGCAKLMSRAALMASLDVMW